MRSSDARPLYIAAAFGGERRKTRLSRAIKAFKIDCIESRASPAGADDLRTAMAKMVFWPSREQLDELDAAVAALAFVEGKKPPTPTWTSYKLVDRRLRGLRLISSINKLVARAERLLRDERKSDRSQFTQLVTRATNGGAEGASAKTLLDDLRKIRQKLSAARDIEWERHDTVLFPRKSRRLVCGASAASLRVFCYARAMEIIVEKENFPTPNREKVLPLLKWIVALENPDYSKRFGFDDFFQLMTEYARRSSTEKKASGKRAKAAERQRWHRYLESKIFAEKA